MLNISHNNFSGFIPIAFEEMRWLSYVDISYNKLEGVLFPIAKQLNNLT